MGRRKVTEQDRTRALRLGIALGQLRGNRLSAERLARLADVSVDTVRKLEQGRSAHPGLFIVSAIVHELGGNLSDVVATAEEPS